jgi:hypothetical protein
MECNAKTVVGLTGIAIVIALLVYFRSIVGPYYSPSSWHTRFSHWLHTLTDHPIKLALVSQYCLSS